MKTDFRIVPYGEIRSSLSSWRGSAALHPTRALPAREGQVRTRRTVFVALSRDLNPSFIEMFRRQATEETKLLILNEGTATDSLLSRIMELQVRTPQRLCVIDGAYGSGKTHRAGLFIRALLDRLASGLKSEEAEDRILNARIDRGVLHVVSPRFERLEIAVEDIPAFKDARPLQVEEFEIDEDGAFIYWPKLDVHLGWRQLQQLIDPKAALQASQKFDQFNKRYGKAVQFLREKAGLKRSDVTGLSEKQLGRIEKGECRLTSNAIEALAAAHKLAPNDYMREAADALEKAQR